MKYYFNKTWFHFQYQKYYKNKTVINNIVNKNNASIKCSNWCANAYFDKTFININCKQDYNFKLFQ